MFVRDCNAGFQRNPGGTSCVPCGAGTYREAGGNRVVETEPENTCLTCPTCTNGVTYQTAACQANRATQCAACRTACSAGQFKSRACNPLNDTGCTSCVTSCPVDMRLSLGKTCSGNEAFDQVLAACVNCTRPGTCVSGFYLNWRCTGSETVSNECRPCSARSCPGDQYAGGCGNFTDTQCISYTICGAGFYLEDESRTRDGVCRPCSSCGDLPVLVPCTRFNNVICRGDSCGQFTPCPRRTGQNRSGYFCNYGAGAGNEYCGVCPSGYDSDGQYCLECPRGTTCNRVGEIECRGQCEAGVSSRCESIWDLGYAVCDTPCSLPPPSTRVPWRGSYVRALETDCATYFLCTAGSYKDFSPGGTLECKPCVGNGSAGLARWVTEGLSVGDAGSCLWECRRELALQGISRTTGMVNCTARGWTIQPATNEAGEWAGPGGMTGGACGTGRTSEAKSAMRPEECVDCPPLVPNVQAWSFRTIECGWYCSRENDELRGGACVPRRYDCDNRPGVVRVADGGLYCVSTSFPWNRPGWEKTGWGVPVKNTSLTAVVTGSNQPTFASRAWGWTGRHTVSMSGYPTRSVEGALCSATRGNVSGREYIFGALCNHSALVWLDPAWGNVGLGVLIGNATQRGWRDGFRTQALFESELYVAWGGRSLFVLDRWNCLLREVVIWERPGDYRTRAYTLWGNTQDLLGLIPPQPKCYGEGALAWPRRWWTLGEGWLAFSDEDGLWQLHTETRELLLIVGESQGGFEADALITVGVEGFMVVLGFAGEVWRVPAAQQECASGFTSLAGGACTIECPWQDSLGAAVRYVDRSTGLCQACSVPVCGLGFEPVLCTSEMDGYCRACAPLESGLVYVVPGTCEPTARRRVSPCVAGFYAAGIGGGYCEECPPFTSTRFGGAVRVEQCKCLDGLTRQRDGTCKGEGLFEYDAGVCTRVGGCQVPANARLLPAGFGGEACVWTCNNGYYRDSSAGFASQCRVCLTGGVLTNGDDDSPWSCE